MPKISCCIITMNQSDRLKMAIGNIKNYVDEVVVVDGGSKDDSVKIAKELGAKVYFREWDDDFGAQRNYSLAKVSNDWVLVIDSDEIFEFGEEGNSFKKIIAEYPEADGFIFTRSNFLDDEKTGSIGDFDRQLRLFLKTHGKYTETIHETARGLKNVVEIPKSTCLMLHYKSRKEQKKHLKYQRKLMIDFIKQLESKKELLPEEQKALANEKMLLERWDIWWQDAN